MSGSLSGLGRLLPVLAVFWALTGCDRGDSGDAVVEEQLESGAVRLTFTEFSPRFLEFDVRAKWDIWSPDAPYVFSEVADVVGGEESFFLLDGGNTEVVEFGPGGELRNVFGREGSGSPLPPRYRRSAQPPSTQSM